MKSGAEGETEDRVAWWPLAFAIGVPLVLVICSASPLGTDIAYVLVGIPFLLLVWAMSAVVTAFHLAGSLRARAWRRALSLAVLPAFVLAAAPAPLAFVRTCHQVGDMIHFEIMRGHYQSVVRSMPDTGQPKLAIFDWGGAFSTGIGVVYDQSDEVALPPEKQSAAWRTRADKTELTCDGYSVTPMGDHFYIATFPC